MRSELRDILLRQTLDLGASSGLARLSLRQIATAAGVSTTAIFQNFASKAELFAMTTAHAVDLDTAFHRAFAEDAFHLVSDHKSLADLMVAYVQLRASGSQSRFISEMLVNLRDHPECVDVLRSWHASRVTEWQGLLVGLGVDPRLGEVMASYLIMEVLYAHALQHSSSYRLLLAETCRAVCDAALNDGTGRTSGNVGALLDVRPFAIRGPSESGARQPVAEQLLASAVEIINESGMRMLNQRALAARAGVSGSLIAYHFGDMKSLSTQAIWRALVQGIPSQLDPRGDSSTFPGSLDEWFGILEAMLEVGEHRARGFYVSVAQLSAEACLFACHNPQLMPLVTYLRGLEGWGTYRVSRTLPAVADLIGRDHATSFGVWIKSEALLRYLGIRSGPEEYQPVSVAAALIFPVGRDVGKHQYHADA